MLKTQVRIEQAHSLKIGKVPAISEQMRQSNGTVPVLSVKNTRLFFCILTEV